MGRKKSKSVLQPLLQVYPSQICAAMDGLVMTRALPTLPWNNTSYQVVTALHFDWYVAAFWIAYEIMPIPDRNREPYNTPQYRELESWGTMLHSMLTLCKGCGKFSTLMGTSPWTLWLDCLKEAKRNQVNFVLGPIPPHPTGAFVEVKRHFLADLRNGRVPNLKDSPHLYEVIGKAQEVRAGLNSPAKRVFDNQYWNPFVSSYQAFIEDSRKGSASKLYFVEEDRLLIPDKRHLRQVPVPKPLPEKRQTHRKPVLQEESYAIGLIPWSKFSVYVS